jgi:hypothetical protein
MSAHICIDCDSPGDGNCSACRGSGRIGTENFLRASGGDSGETSCPSCGGSGLCPKCEGSGEIEIGGEG